MSRGTRHSSAVSPGGHRKLGDGQHSDSLVRCTDMHIKHGSLRRVREALKSPYSCDTRL